MSGSTTLKRAFTKATGRRDMPPCIEETKATSIWSVSTLDKFVNLYSPEHDQQAGRYFRSSSFGTALEGVDLSEPRLWPSPRF